MRRERIEDAEQMWLELSPIKGDAEDDGHKEWIVVSGYGFGVSKGQTGHSFSSLSIEKYVDCASPDLMIHAADKTQVGKIAKAKLHVKAAKTNEVFLELEFMKPYVRSVSSAGQGQGDPKETLTLGYEEISYKVDNASAKKWNVNTQKGS